VARTGINAETIRAWERRYGAIQPVRTEGGTRKFSEEDVTRLLCLKALRERGFGLQALAQLPTSELVSMSRAGQESAPRPQPVQPPLAPEHHAYLQAIERLDAPAALEQLKGMTEGVGNLRLILQVTTPIMWEVGRRWSEGTLGVAHEHLVSAQLKQILMGRLEQIPAPEGAPRLMFTTPAGQLHEFGILAGSVLAKEAGFDVLYLGPNMPSEDIIWSVAQSQTDVLVLSIVRQMDEEQMQQMERLVDTVSVRVPVWIGCPPAHPLITRLPKATFISSIEDFQAAAATLLSVKP
jgi:methanogenic corrinoid protein MtbC1